jgi:hypothetical protein
LPSTVIIAFIIKPPVAEYSKKRGGVQYELGYLTRESNLPKTNKL